MKCFLVASFRLFSFHTEFDKRCTQCSQPNIGNGTVSAYDSFTIEQDKRRAGFLLGLCYIPDDGILHELPINL
jgi:hypothetical protein